MSNDGTIHMKTGGTDLENCEELVEIVANYMALGFHKFQLKRKLEDELGMKPGSLSQPTYEHLRNKAKALMASNMNISVHDVHARALSVLDSILRSSHSPAMAKIAALQELVKVARAGETAEVSNADKVRDLLNSMNKSVADEEEGGDEYGNPAD